MQGIIVKGIAGFYYVKVQDTIYECKARGKFRHHELSPIVGDKVDITVKNEKGVIEKIYTRLNKLVRPPVANVTQAFVVFSIINPEFTSNLLNKFLVLCEANNIKVKVCINKIDLVDKEALKPIQDLLKNTGYELKLLNAKKGIGINDLKKDLENNITVVCGPSGVGKSTIMNYIAGSNVMKTGDISSKLKRGKNTTRHCELVTVGEGFVVDTPGFSSLDLNFIEKDELKDLFPEFLPYSGLCKYSTCMHNKEPQCKIKEAVEKGEISKERYDFYIDTLNKLSVRRNYK
ncbi:MULTISPECIES: ribosome small subunit-dependent GTPase A [Clostridium]|uniref:ribosome small subunit-dependent GTPase A n=1 Tax=Clostridium TaxID=1485 RepID=UPI0008268159|nr:MULTISPECIES: ribosome small subunit-dependent GTPase A [Clostridium]PJI06638.1 ribosome small subunit-dependent GTPase A [Clostridium sp. CT7]